MASVSLDTDFLKSNYGRKSVEYLQRLKDDGATDLAICQALNDAVSSKKLSISILTLYFSCRWNKTPELAATAIKHGSGVSLRRRGIDLTGLMLAKPRKWEAMWKLLGGTEGLIVLFAAISVHEVKLLSRAMFLHSMGPRIPAREQAIEELVKALLPRYYPESEIQSQDKRPLQHLYARMLPSCSSKFVNALLDAKDDSNPLYKHGNRARVLKAHRELIQKRIKAAILQQGVMDDYTQRALSDLLHRDRAFALHTVSLRLKDEVYWPPAESELNIVTHHLSKAMRKARTPDAELRSILSLTLQVAQEKRQRVHDLWPALCSLWQRKPTLYEDLFIRALSRDLASPQMEIGQTCHSSLYGSSVKQWDWALLRLYCLHVPKDGVDIDTATDLMALQRRTWPITIFDMMSGEQAQRMLAGLYAVNPDCNFLDPGQRSPSIFDFRQIGCMRWNNFNVDLLTTTWERGSEEALSKAKSTVDKLRQKAGTSREQEDRAEIARAASVFAIASGDLDLYQETVTWQQRFVKDALTVKKLYSQDVVLTAEGIELLTGIPEKLPVDMTLQGVLARISKANDILVTFHDTRVIARREPSYQSRDWNHVTSLTGQVLKRRALQLKEFMNNQFPDKPVEAFSLLWESSLILVDKLNEDVQSIQSIAVFYEDNIPSVSLAAIAKIMLDSVAERCQKKGRQRIDDFLDAMAQSIVRRIADGEDPEQAAPLVLQIVLERPDESSLHRSLLSVGLLKTLPASHARKLLLAFAAGIGERLEEQSYVKVGEAELPKSAPSQPLVKVTTAKYLPQLLDNADFISLDTAIEVLIELFTVAQHRDVRLATLQSLLTSLNDICYGPPETWRSNALFQRIFEALEIIVPVAASINEHRPPREEDWKEATGKMLLPEISDISAGAPPLFGTVLAAPKNYVYPNLDKVQTEFVTRLIYPMIMKSEEEHQRWMSLFLAKYGASFGVESLPPAPISPRVWQQVLPYYSPPLLSEILEGCYQYLRTTFALPSDLKEFNKSLRSDTSLRNNPEVQHWFWIYDQDRDNYFNTGLSWLMKILDHFYESGASISRLIDMVVDLVSAMLQDYENRVHTWTTFVSELQPPFELSAEWYPDPSSESSTDGSSEPSSESSTDGSSGPSFAEDHQTWKDTRLPILEKATELLVKQWDRKRRSVQHQGLGELLPPVIELQILLLPYPRFRGNSDVEADCDTFVTKLDSLILSTLQDGENVLHWAKIGEALSKMSELFRVDEYRIQLAPYIGRLGNAQEVGKMSPQLLLALKLVKLRFAMTLIQDGWAAVETGVKGAEQAKFEALARRLKTVVQAWQSSSDESIVMEIVEWRRAKEALWTKLTS